MTEKTTKVFISYSWDSEEHKKSVLNLADKLREECGLDADMDKYVRAEAPFTPEEGWNIWMQKKIAWADFVLIACTETYKRRFEGDEEPGIGLGASWEARIINQHLYNCSANIKFIPVVFSASDLKHVPLILDSADKYIIDQKESYEELCCRLKNLGTVRKPEIRKIDPELSREPVGEKITATNSYTILSLTDSSHGRAKRYSAHVLLNKDYSKPDIAIIARDITTDLKTREYYRNNQLKQQWKGRDAQVIWLFLYLAMDDFDSVDWICRTQWISKDLPSEFSPIGLDGEYIDGGIIVEWNENYGQFTALSNISRMTKEDYLDSMNRILDITKLIVNQAITITIELDLKQRLSEDEHVVYMSQLEPKVNKLYLEAIHIGSAPTECSDLSQRFQCVMAMAHNIVLPFSEKGLETMERSNRTYLVNQAINDYQQDLLRLEFELEKVH